MELVSYMSVAAVPALIVLLVAVPYYFLSSYLLKDDDVDCMAKFTAHDAKHSRHSAMNRALSPMKSSKVTKVSGRNPLR
jgi:hypothetical protein